MSWPPYGFEVLGEPAMLNRHLQFQTMRYTAVIHQENRMHSEPNESFFIGDTSEGKVLVTATVPEILSGEPCQLLLIYGKNHVQPPSKLMTRSDFRKWRESLQGEGCRVELRFA